MDEFNSPAEGGVNSTYSGSINCPNVTRWGSVRLIADSIAIQNVQINTCLVATLLIYNWVKESNVFNYYLRRYKGYKKEVYLDSYWSCGTNGEKW
jgi:hypothetical protein